MDARSRAIEAIVKNTVDGPVRARAIAAVGQLNTRGIPFKLFLDGTKKQNEAVLKTLRYCGITEQVTAAKPGVKPTYITTDGFRDEPKQNGTEALLTKMAKETQAELEDEPWISDEDQEEMIWIHENYSNYFASYEDAYKLVIGLHWDKPAGVRYEEMVKEAKLRGVSFEGRVGDAIDSVCWTLSTFEWVTIEDFPDEGRSNHYGVRTLRSAIAVLRDKGLLTVEHRGGYPAIYRATIWNEIAS